MGELVPPVGAAAKGDVGARVHQPDLTRGSQRKIWPTCVSASSRPRPSNLGGGGGGEMVPWAGSWWTSMALQGKAPKDSTRQPLSPGKKRTGLMGQNVEMPLPCPCLEMRLSPSQSHAVFIHLTPFSRPRKLQGSNPHK